MSDEETIEETEEEEVAPKPKRARRARKSKTRQPAKPAHFFDEETDGDSDSPVPQTFTAILTTSFTYQLGGYTFHRNIAKPNLPMSLYEKIKCNGNFIIP